jgi:hypothetical protein
MLMTVTGGYFALFGQTLCFDLNILPGSQFFAAIKREGPSETFRLPRPTQGPHVLSGTGFCKPEW